MRLQEVRAQSEEDMNGFTSGQGEPDGEPNRPNRRAGCSYSAAAYSSKGNRLRLARAKMLRGIKILLPPKQQLKFIKQKYIAGILREY